MDLAELIVLLQSSYQSELVALSQAYASTDQELTLEVGFQLSNGSLFVVDGIATDSSGPVAIEIDPGPSAYHGPLDVMYDGMNVNFERVHWGAVALEVMPSQPLEEILATWQATWFNVDDPAIGTPPFRGFIHSVTIEGNSVEIDFGSASAQAALDLFDLLALAGVVEVSVSDARDAQRLD